MRRNNSSSCYGNAYFTNSVQVYGTSYTVSLTNDIISNFEDQQILKIKTPNDMPTTSVTLYKFNEKPIDTLLQSGKYYELLYDEPNDRFIVNEERV